MAKLYKLQTPQIGSVRKSEIKKVNRPSVSSTREGFTLMELSIVLVIIGLLVGGVLVGNDLVKAAEMRSTISKIEQVDVAKNAFRLKYNCLPGDCIASRFGIVSDAIDGDGGGYYGDGTHGVTYGIDEWTSYMLFQLEGSGLLKSDVDDNGSFQLPLGSGAVFKTYNFDVDVSDFGLGAISRRDDSYSECGVGYCYALSSLQAKNLDSKIDDGQPNSGKIRALGIWDDYIGPNVPATLPSAGAADDGTSCITDATPAEYNNLDGSDRLCSLYVKYRSDGR